MKDDKRACWLLLLLVIGCISTGNHAVIPGLTNDQSAVVSAALEILLKNPYEKRPYVVQDTTYIFPKIGSEITRRVSHAVITKQIILATGAELENLFRKRGLGWTRF